MSGFHPFGGRVSRHFGDNLSPEDAYLSYHDVRLTKEDVDCIRSDWLTDNAIAFWEEYLEREELKHFPKANIVLLRPTMSFMLMQTPDPSVIRDALPDLTHTTHVFLPINDNRNPSIAEGGSHWSLLLVSLIDGVAFHYDSLSQGNRFEAQAVTNKLSQLLKRRIKFVSMADSPQQQNGSDCGIFVCMIMRYLLVRRLLRVDSREKISMSVGARKIDARDGRKEMLKVIQGFRKEGERRRSRSPSPSPMNGFRSGKDGSTSKSPPRIGDEQEDYK